MPDEILEYIARIHTRMSGLNHRALIVLEGEHDWSTRLADAIRTQFADARTVCISDSMPDALMPAINLVNKLVGQEFNFAIYDAFSGLDPNLLGGLSGTLRGGGLLVMCTPPHEQWPQYKDPVRKRVLSYPQVITGPSQYLLRFIRLLRQSDNVYVIRQDSTLPALSLTSRHEHQNNRPQRQGQRDVVGAVQHQCSGHAHRPLVILADRGRGKSSALGMACAELMLQGKNIILSATRKQATAIVYKHIDLAFTRQKVPGAERDRRMAHLRFIPPDALAYQHYQADLVIVDEAATIGISLLIRILNTYPRIVFASTVNGYEGTGRGLELKLFPRLDKQAPGWKLMQLEDPIRWSRDDPLEDFLNQALLLKHVLPDVTQHEAFEQSELAFATAQAEDFQNNEELLQQIYGLLVISHYRTTPLDLRILLDNPAIQVHYVRSQDQVVATAMTIQEGGITDAPLNQDISSGNRRVHGHLLPQALTYYTGIADSMTLSCTRVIRIAVYPKLQRMGIGSALLKYIEAKTAMASDYIGASFALDENALPIWLKAGYQVVRIGFSAGPSSGQHAAFVVKGLSAQGTQYLQRWKAYHDRNFTSSIPALFRDIRPELLSSLMTDTTPADDVDFTELDHKSLEDFFYQQKDIDFVFGDLHRLINNVCGTDYFKELGEPEKTMLMLRFVQMEDWRAIQRMTGAKGKNEIIDRIRTAARKLYEHLTVQ